MKKNDHAQKTERIIDAMRGLIAMPKGRHIRRFTHGWHDGMNRTQYFVGYVWQRLHSDPYRGMTYDAILGKGADFDSALADAIKKETAKQKRREASSSQAQS